MEKFASVFDISPGCREGEDSVLDAIKEQMVYVEFFGLLPFVGDSDCFDSVASPTWNKKGCETT